MTAPLTTAETSLETEPPPGAFEFRGPGGMIRAQGEMMPIRRGTSESLADRIAQALKEAPPRTIIGGALPFSRSGEDYLFRADRATTRRRGEEAAPVENPIGQLRANPSAQGYANAVARAVDLVQREALLPAGLRKVVLARTLEVKAAQPIAIDALMARLSDDDSVTAFQVALPRAAGQQQARSLVGATPELLLEKRGRKVLSYPLAGSARRSRDLAEDAQAAALLAGSEKDRREHAMVVEYILDLLSPHCSALTCPEGTRLTCTRSMWHLGTRISGSLKDPETPSVVLASVLHPTPAVCGLPCQRAEEFIERVEPVSRDFYAGAVGWSDAAGDGAWYVAIRCADICGHQARLFAGAGIVDGSDPLAETAETASKFAAMLNALGLPADLALTE